MPALALFLLIHHIYYARLGQQIFPVQKTCGGFAKILRSSEIAKYSGTVTDEKSSQLSDERKH